MVKLYVFKQSYIGEMKAVLYTLIIPRYQWYLSKNNTAFPSLLWAPDRLRPRSTQRTLQEMGEKRLSQTTSWLTRKRDWIISLSSHWITFKRSASSSRFPKELWPDRCNLLQSHRLSAILNYPTVVGRSICLLDICLKRTSLMKLKNILACTDI